MTNRTGAGLALSLLFAINTVSFFDRQILAAVAELVRKDPALSDTPMGSLGTAFTTNAISVGGHGLLGKLGDLWKDARGRPSGPHTSAALAGAPNDHLDSTRVK